MVAKHGVAPASIPDLLALVGDTADGIPGLAGLGQELGGQAALGLSPHPRYPRRSRRHGRVALRGADRLARALREHRAEANLYRTLATLRTDCPITCDAAALAWRGVDRPALDAICDEVGVDPASVRL